MFGLLEQQKLLKMKNLILAKFAKEIIDSNCVGLDLRKHDLREGMSAY
mgnify:CR=1 FL=1